MHYVIVLVPLLAGALGTKASDPPTAPATRAETTTATPAATPTLAPNVTATVAPSATAPATTSPGSSEPWYTLYRGTKFGVGLDVGYPGGAGVVGLFRPWWWLRTNAGLAYDVMGFGIRGGVSLVPGHWAVTPTLNLDVGHFFGGDLGKFGVSASTDTERRLLGQAAFDFASAQLGVEFGSQRGFAFYVRGGLVYIGNTSFAAKDVAAWAQENQGSGGGTWGANSNLTFRALTPCLSLGFNLFVF